MKMKTNNENENLNNDRGDKDTFIKTESMEIKAIRESPLLGDFIIKFKGSDDTKIYENELLIYDDDLVQISSTGFSEVREGETEENSKLIFAYQIRKQEKVVIIHIPLEIQQDKIILENIRNFNIRNFLLNTFEYLKEDNYNYVFSHVYLKLILNEVKTLINLERIKKKR